MDKVSGSDRVIRIACGVEYDGSQFRGWQLQKHDPVTVQAALEEALSKIANEPIRVICAGRTDAGVHASLQVVHFDTAAVRDNKAWSRGTNTLLPDTVAVKWARTVPQTFHARYSAMARTYRYVIYNHSQRPGMLRPFLSWFYQPLCVARMEAAAQFLLGEQDFTSLRAKDCQSRSANRYISDITLTQSGPFIVVEVTANAFLKHMVRNIIGVLVAVGRGDQSPQWVAEVLAAKNRAAAGVTAPPQGLSLVNIAYPEAFNLPIGHVRHVPLSAVDAVL